ncbi:MAG: hypothetical protein ACYC61_23910 [Isosphaeraceae bacterium]
MARPKMQADEGKTGFVRRVLEENPHANVRIVNDEWQAAGNDGEISQSLVNKQRSQMGLTGNIKGGRPKGSTSTSATAAATAEKPAYTGKKRGRKPKSAHTNGHHAASNGVALEPARKSGGRQTHLTEVETEIDRLLFRVMSLGGLEEVEESLRRTRRLLYQAAHVERS